MTDERLQELRKLLNAAPYMRSSDDVFCNDHARELLAEVEKLRRVKAALEAKCQTWILEDAEYSLGALRLENPDCTAASAAWHSDCMARHDCAVEIRQIIADAEAGT